MTSLTHATSAIFTSHSLNRPNESMHSATVISKKMISQNTLEIALSLDDKSSFDNFRAGECIRVDFKKGEHLIYQQDTHGQGILIKH
ncbi:MAG: hypothetical protein OXE99_03615 [Cellvibrionales bacterium]|nr:hypothetical protein [Cellvibrionales bacterium]